jgi:predicted ATPase
MCTDDVEELFHSLIELQGPERLRRLAEIEARDPRLREDLDSLIEAYEDCPAFLRPPATDRGALPERLNKYRIVREIGRGAAGVVYLAEDPDLGRSVAIKTLTSSGIDPAGAEALRGEARALAAVTHPNIAHVHSIETLDIPGDVAGLAFLTMEYVPGITLAERLRHSPLALESALDIARQILAALEAAHSRSIVHRDLKPANIRITDDGWVKVLDFGLATLVSSDERSSRSAGTPGYMSPEQCRGERVDERSDLWSFGAILYECFTGTTAIPGESLGELVTANCRGDVDLDALPEFLPGEIIGLLRSCLEIAPTRRMISASAARILVEDELLRVRIESLVGIEAGAVAEGTRSTPQGESAPGGTQLAPRHARVQGNLPRPLSAYVGRADLLATIEERMSASPLITLCGAGGVGKTRTAIECAARSSAACEGGCWFVDLSEIARDGDIPSAVARALRLGAAAPVGGPDAIEEAIGRSVGAARSLILLDNCEHLLEEAAGFAERLLARCPTVTIVATSRQPLGIEGEEVITITPLPLPEPTAGTRREGASEAVELFLKRARGRLPISRLSAEDLGIVEEICKLVDGLPLAIELAASHARSLSLTEIRRRITEGESLADVSTRRPERHRSLKDLVEWSYRLLSPTEAALFRRLSVFRGGCRLADAEAVCAGSREDEWQIYESLAHLVERSLVEPDTGVVGQGAEPSPAVRYRLLETIRTYAATLLAEREEEREEVETRYIEQMIRTAAPLPNEDGPTSSVWVRRVEPDYANLIHAMDMAVAGGDLARAFVIGSRLSRYWIQTGTWIEGLQRLEGLIEAGSRVALAALDSTHTVTPQERDRIDVMGQAGRIAATLGQREKAQTLTARAVEAARALGEPIPLARSLQSDGVSAWFRIDHGHAAQSFEDALAIFTSQGDRAGRAVCLANLGAIHSVAGDHSKALEYHRSSLALCREMGDSLAEAKGLLNLGRTELMLGRPDAARGWLEEALVVHVRNRDTAGTAMTHHHLGDLELAQGRLDVARAHLLESMRLRVKVGDLPGVTSVLTSIARVIEAQGDPGRAAEIVIGVLRSYSSNEIAHLPEQRSRLEDWKSSLTERLGGAAMAVAAVRGETRSLVDLIDWVTQVCGGDLDPPRERP